MQVVRWLFAIVVLAVCARGADAQSLPQGAAGSMRDTLPEHVALRVYEAFKRHDLDATYANYDSVFTYERFGDPARTKAGAMTPSDGRRLTRRSCA
jgi:hypothetical protein